MALSDTAALIASLELQDKFSSTVSKYDKAVAGMQQKSSTLEKVGFQIGRGARSAVDNTVKIAAVGAGLIASQVALGVRSLAQLETVKNQTAAALESTKGVANVTADEVRNLSEALEDLSTVDDKVIQAGANLLLTFTNVRNEVGKGNDIFNQATDAALNLSLAGFGDMATTAKQVGKALNDPIKGVAALRKAGVQLTDQQTEQIKKFVESGQILKAQKVILAELETQVGQSAEAFGKGPAADMRRFGDAIEGAQQALAIGFLPLIQKVSKLVQRTLANPEVQDGIKAFGRGLAGGLENLIDFATKLPWRAIADAAKLVGSGAKALLDAFTGLPPWIQTAVLTGWGLNKLTGGALGSIAKTLTGALFNGRGSTAFNPVFTKEVGLPGGGGGPPLSPGGRFGGVLGLAGLIALPVAAGLALAEFVRTVEDVDAKIGHNLLDQFNPPKPSPQSSTPLGQFTAANAGGTPVPVKIAEGSGAFNAITIGLKFARDAVRNGLRENDIHAARFAQKQLDSLNKLRGEVAHRVNDIIPHLGKVNRGLSTANRNLEQGNTRQRELAQGIREARSSLQTGFSRTNANLGVTNSRLSTIAAKDFSPNVAVTVPVSNYVSISEVTRVATSTAFASGFTPRLLNG